MKDVAGVTTASEAEHMDNGAIKYSFAAPFQVLCDPPLEKTDVRTHVSLTRRDDNNKPRQEGKQVSKPTSC